MAYITTAEVDDMRSNTLFTVIFVFVVAAVLIGEVYVHTADNGRYSSDVRVAGDNLEYSVTSKGSECYSVVVSDNGDFERIERYYIFYDAGHGSKLEKVPVPVGAKELTQEYHISQLVTVLNDRGVRDIEILDAASVGDMCTDLPAASSAGLVVLSGALPDTIYTGQITDPVFGWINAGGSLYWAGNAIGAYYSTSGNGVETVPDTFDHELAFFGVTDRLNTGDENVMLSDVTDNDYRHSLSLMNNRVRYGVDITGLTGISVGYTDGKYSSAALVKRGDGMICVIAGDHSNNQRHDLAQIIASGICYDSEEAGYESGDVKRNTVTGTVTINDGIGFDSGHNYSAYVYCGGYFTVYGRTTGWTQ